jgi:hypothetical protein
MYNEAPAADQVPSVVKERPLMAIVKVALGSKATWRMTTGTQGTLHESESVERLV